MTAGLTKGQIVWQVCKGVVLVLAIAAVLNAQMAAVLVWLAVAAGGALPLCVIRAVRAEDESAALPHTVSACVCGTYLTFTVLRILSEIAGIPV